VALTLKKPWTQTTTFEGGSVSTTSGTINDIVRDDRPTPRRTKPAGPWRPPTPYYRTIEEGDVYTYNLAGRFSNGYAWQSDASCPLTLRSGVDNVSGYYYDPVPTIPSGVQEELIRKARAKIKGQDINLSTAFGERAATADMVAGTCKTLADAVRAVRRRDPDAALRALGVRRRGKRKFPKEPSNMWLQMQYGWLPMLNDVHGACKALEDADEDRDRYRATATATWKGKEIVKRSLRTSVSSSYVDLDKVLTKHHKAKIRLDYVLRNPALASLASLGVTNPASLAWELLPFSFVADWFVPIGSYLSDLDATFGWDFMGGSFTAVSEQRSRAHYLRVVPSGAEYGIINRRGTYAIVSGHGRQMAMSRSVYSAEPTASVLHVSGDPLSARRLTSAISLLAQAFL
jgi:hypothetical protein